MLGETHDYRPGHENPHYIKHYHFLFLTVNTEKKLSLKILLVCKEKMWYHF